MLYFLDKFFIRHIAGVVVISEINEMKFHPFFQENSDFFESFKPKFIHLLAENLNEKSQCSLCILDKETMANNIFKALFDPYADCFEESFCCIGKLKENGVDIGFFFSDLMYQTIASYIAYAKESPSSKTQELIGLCSALQQHVAQFLSTESDPANKQVTLSLTRNSASTYFHNMQRLDRRVKLFIHTSFGTSSSPANIEQIGENSIILTANDEQISMARQTHSAFILKNEEDERNYSAKASILCTKERKLLLENFCVLNTAPLLSRKYPRAAIVHTSLVHIANEHEYITGNMLDISEGGIGIMSSSKSQFQKGQDIVAFVSYEDEEHNFKFSFEASGIITSIIGKHSAFRYGIQLELEEEEKELIRELINFLNHENR